MAEFLSPTWIAELDAAARQVPVGEGAADPDARALRVAVDIADAPGGPVRYVMVLDRAAAWVVGGEPESADVTLCLPYAVARRIHSGEANAQRVLAEGSATVEGDLNRLVASAADLARLQDAFAALRATTTFPG